MLKKSIRSHSDLYQSSFSATARAVRKIEMGDEFFNLPVNGKAKPARQEQIVTEEKFNFNGRETYGSLFTPLADQDFRGQIRSLFRHLQTAGTFLDIGCGFGNMLHTAKEVNPKLEVFGLEIQKRQARVAAEFGTVFRADALNYRKYSHFDVLYMYRPLVEYRDQLALEDLVIKSMRIGATLISLIPAHHLLCGNGQRGVFTKEAEIPTFLSRFEKLQSK